ncbi:MAG: hypothetical protein M3O70_22050 [Actinomycetota bacterium]|nr:hypothetical protein [Actinomycetota bacterium]
MSTVGGYLADRRKYSLAVRYELWTGDFRRLAVGVDTALGILDSGARAYARDLTNGFEDAARKAATGSRFDRYLAGRFESLGRRVGEAEIRLAHEHAVDGAIRRIRKRSKTNTSLDTAGSYGTYVVN